MSVDRRTIIVRGLSRTNIASCFSITRSSSTRNTCGERASVAPSGANTLSILIRWVREPDGSLPTGYRRWAPSGPVTFVKSVMKDASHRLPSEGLFGAKGGREVGERPLPPTETDLLARRGGDAARDGLAGYAWLGRDGRARRGEKKWLVVSG